MQIDRKNVGRRDDEYQYWMDLLNQDWELATRKFINKLTADPKYTTKSPETVRNLEAILAGDVEAWQKGSGIRDSRDAARIAISNALLRGMNLGVLPGRKRYYEDIAAIVANIITEDVNFAPMTSQERRIKLIAESYGLVVYRLS